MKKDPLDRYQTMTEVKAVLEKAVQRKVVVSSVEPQPSIAVLPFINMSGDKEQEKQGRPLNTGKLMFYLKECISPVIVNTLHGTSGLTASGF